MSDLNNLFLMEIEGFNVAKDLEEALKITQPQQKAWGSLLKTYNSLCKSKKRSKINLFPSCILTYTTLCKLLLTRFARFGNHCVLKKNPYEILLGNTLTHFFFHFTHLSPYSLNLTLFIRKNCIFLSKKTHEFVKSHKFNS